jgi:hypothetical protein
MIVGLLPDPRAWGDHARPFRGLVVGAVQGGKTASMGGVVASALDHGFRLVIVLAGGKDDLRQQTARRFNTQLLLQSDVLPGRRDVRTMPTVDRPLGGFALPMKDDAHLYAPLYLRAHGALLGGQPVVLVIKKHVAALESCRAMMAPLTAALGGGDALPTLVLDDECDDASVETVGSDGAAVPTAIAQLWAPIKGQALPVAYVGYTATAAANLLQHPESPLFPADFVTLLRTPGPEDSPLEFLEPEPDRWYTGGEAFHRAFGEQPSEAGNFLVVPTVTADDLAHSPVQSASLAAAVRAYLVGAAYRLTLDPTRDPQNPTCLPAPHCMLVQTSATRSEHRVWADALRARFGVDDLGALNPRAVPLCPSKVTTDVAANESAWRGWYDAFRQSRERIYAERPHSGAQLDVTWAAVRARLEAVVRATRIRVVNSDEVVGATLDFAPSVGPLGEPVPPADLYSIVVGGTKLSRGLTLEGLCISYFTRWSDTPTEDTVLQLCRWFGYRGPQLEFCRLFTTEEIASELRDMHENDLALRYQLADLMARRLAPSDAAVVLSCNPHSLPTAKRGVGVSRNVAFSPFDRVFRSLEVGPLAGANEEAALRLVSEVRTRAPEEVRTSANSVRGILSRGWTASEVAAWLETFEYIEHNPDPASNAARAHYRSPDLTRPLSSARRVNDDPYQVAAYLREWSARAERTAGEAGPPSFNVGVVFGSVSDECAPFDFPLLNREVSAKGVLQSGWTGRSAHWPGDIRFDVADAYALVSDSGLRHAGAPGLLLLHVIHRAALGRSGEGEARAHHSPTFGVVIPEGGPAFRRVIVDHRRAPVVSAVDTGALPRFVEGPEHAALAPGLLSAAAD